MPNRAALALFAAAALAAGAAAPVPSADELVQAAASRSAAGDSAGAERALRSALTLKPDDPAILAALAQALRDRPEEAEPLARRAGAWRLLGEIQADLGKRREAEASLERALERDGGDMEALRALVRLKRGEGAAAAPYARRASAAAETAPAWCRSAARRYAAQILDDAGDPGGALASLERALSADPDDLKALRLMVSILERSPDARRPRETARPPEAAPRPGGELDALKAGFDAALAGGRAADARGFAERFAAAAPAAPSWQRYDAYRLSVEMRLALGDRDGSRKAMAILDDRDDQALETLRLWHRVYPESTRGPGEGEWLAIDVRLRQRLGDDAGADAAVDRALARFPGDRGVLQVAVDFKRTAGRLDEARAAGRRLLAAYESATPADMLSVFPDHTYFAGRRISEREKLQAALQDAGLVAQARREREEGRRAALEEMARIEAASGRASEARRYLASLEKSAEAAAPRARADAIFRAARARRALGDQDGASADLGRALALAPADPEILREAAEVEEARGRPAEALALALRREKACANEPPRTRADAARATARLEAALKDEAGAEDALRRALSALPDDRSALSDLVELQLSAGRPQDALAAAKRLEAASETGDGRARADAYRKTARVQSALKDADGAAASFARALAAAPDDAESLQGLAELELARGRPEAAAPDAEKLVKSWGDAEPRRRAAAFRLAAQVRGALDDEAGAEADYRRALEAAPGDEGSLRGLMALELSRGRPEAALGYGERLADPAETAAPLRAMIDLELRRGRPEAARPYAERLEKVSGGTPAGRADAARRTAEVQAALGDADGAAAALQRALSAVPEDPQALRQMLDLMVSRGRPEDALPYAVRLEKTLESAAPSDRADAARRTARVRREIALKSGRPEAALADAERVVEEAKGGAPKERAEAYARLAEAQGAAKDVAAQERSLRLALEADPENALAARAWIDLALALGRPEEALPYARRLAASPKAGRAGVPADAYRRLARVQRRLKDEAGAEASLRLALAADPAEPKTYGLLLDLLRARPREALGVVAAVPPEGAPGRAERLGLRGVAEALCGDAASARADFAAAAELDAKALCSSPAFGPGRDLLPPVYFEVCLKRFPADPDLYRDRGVALFRAGRTAEAADAFRKVLELKPGDEEAAESLRAVRDAGPGGRDWPTAPRSAPAGRPSPL